MTMEEKIKNVLGEQAFIIAALQVQMDAARAECEQLKKMLAEHAQMHMFSQAVAEKSNGEARPS
jgi:TRAP-type mannitol/chloroaromatic compound transport system substrate-binding protein